MPAGDLEPSLHQPGAPPALTVYAAAVDPAWVPPGPEMAAVAGLLIAVAGSRHTAIAYARDLGQWRAWLRGFDVDHLADATPQHVDQWRDEMLADGRALKTVGRKLAAVSSFYGFTIEPGGWLEDLGRNPARPTRKRRTPKAAGRRTPALTPEQLAAVHQATAATGDPVLIATVAVLATTGLRIGELLAADRADLRTTEGLRVLWVQHGKGGKQRAVPLVPSTVEALRAVGAYRRPTAAPLIAGPSGARLVDHRVRYSLERLGRQAGLPLKLQPHVFRATVATRLVLDGGADMAEVAVLLGHASTEMTALYVAEARALRGGLALLGTIEAAMAGPVS